MNRQAEPEAHNPADVSGDTVVATRALVVFESMFGHTRKVAEAVAAGMGERMEVTLRDVVHATHADVEGADLVVLGAPTHAFSLSRPSTRADAHGRGAQEGSADLGMREWLAALPEIALGRVGVFDTRVSRVRRLPGSAARKMAGVLRHDGAVIADRKSFFVQDVAGPLLPDELGHARSWGRRLAALVPASARETPPTTTPVRNS
jgi:hypothetical protein